MLQKVWISLSITLLALTVLFSYGNALQGEFLYDDEFLIQKNEIVQNLSLWTNAFTSSSTYGSGFKDSFYRPLQILSYSLIYQFFGLNTVAFHAFNVLLHFLNALLFLTLALKILRSFSFEEQKARSYSLLATLVWAVHPLHTEAVTYISATADPLHTLFGLLFLHASLNKSWPWKALGLMFLTTAFLSKEASVTFPGLLFAILFTQPRLETWKEKWKKIFLQVSPSLLCAGIYAGLRAGPLDFQNSFQFYDTQNVYTESVWVRLYTALAGLPKYVQLWAWPDWLQIDRAFPVYVDFFTAPVLMGFGLFLLSLLGVLRGKQNPLLAFASLWFWAYHSLHTGLLLPLNSFFLEHWMYIPSFSFALVSVYGADQMAKRLSSKFNTKILYGVVLLWTLLLGIRTHFQNEVWSTPISLYKHILTTSKEVARVHNNLGMAYSDRGDSQKAEEHYLKAIEINDIYPQVRHNLGLLYLRQGKIDLGIYQLKEALHIQPDFYPSFIYLSKAYEFQGNEKLKKFYEEKARKAQPQFSKPLTN